MGNTSDHPLARPFVDRLPATCTLPDLSTLETALSTVVAEARATWPAIVVDDAAFVMHLAERVADVSGDLLERLRNLHYCDLYLACGCAAGDASALRQFERAYIPEVARYVARVDNSPVFADEVRQLLRSKLFVATERRRAKILEYSGRGPFGGWLRVVAIRTARNLQRTVRWARPIDDGGGQGLQVWSSGPDPELHQLQQQFASEFRLAFQTTIAAMPERRKNVLRLYYLDQISSPAIARLYGVSGAAVRLWLKDAREAILGETRRLLGERLRLRGTEIDSLIGMMQSQFDLSVSRLLRAVPRGDSGTDMGE